LGRGYGCCISRDSAFFFLIAKHLPDIDLAPPLVAPADPLGFATDICVCPIRRNGDAQENERRAPVGPKPDHGLAG
jgi:hypothetical protein